MGSDKIENQSTETFCPNQTLNSGEWVKSELKDLISLISGAHLNPEDYNRDGNGMPYFTGPTDYTNESEYLTKWTIKTNSFAILNDILLTVKGSGVGSLHHLQLEKVAIGRQIMAIRANTKSDTRFVFYILNKNLYRFQELSKGNMIPGLTRSDILSTKINTPPLPEQRAIANILSTWDTAIQTTQALISQKEQEKKWLMQHLLTGKKRLKGFEKSKWKIQSLDNVVKLIVREIPKPNVLYLGIGLRSHGKGTFLKHDEQPEKNSMDTFYVVRPNDLIVNITFAWEQAIAIVKPEDDGALASHRFPTYEFLHGKGHPDFFRYVIVQPKMKYMLELISPGGAGRNRVMSKSDFLKLEIKIPEFEEQTAIAQVLQTADKEITLLKTKLEQQKLQKKGLMQVLLTGKVRVKKT